MPVEILFDGLPVAFSRTQERAILKRQVVRRSTQGSVQFLQDITQKPRQVLNVSGTHLAEGATVMFRENAQLEWRARGEGRERYEVIVLGHQALALC